MECSLFLLEVPTDCHLLTISKYAPCDPNQCDAEIMIILMYMYRQKFCHVVFYRCMHFYPSGRKYVGAIIIAQWSC